jgi:hypothetical protein
MATVVATLAHTTRQNDHLAWIKKFALTNYRIDVSEVEALYIPSYQGGGGGLYMKSTEKDMGFRGWLQGAKDALGPKRASEAEGKTKGKVIFVRELPPRAKPDAELAVLWIMWHEMGHAVGDRTNPRDVSEAFAYRFEYASLTEGHNSGQLATWGISKAHLKAFYAARKEHTEDSAERKIFDTLVNT